MTDGPPQLRLDDGVAHIALQRPSRRNALTRDDRFELGRLLTRADQDPDVRAVVLTGHGEHFCAGGDITEFTRHRTREEAHDYATSTAQEVFRAVRAMRTPTLARVRGAAAGAGMYLALGCDVVVAEEEAFFHPAHMDLGVIPDWGAIWLMPRLIGVARAKALLLTGDRLPAPRAAQWGLVAECVSATNLDSVVQRYCRRFAAVPELTISLTRQGLDASLDQPLDDFLRWEATAIADTMSSAAHRQRVQAFLAR